MGAQDIINGRPTPKLTKRTLPTVDQLGKLGSVVLYYPMNDRAAAVVDKGPESLDFSGAVGNRFLHPILSSNDPADAPALMPGIIGTILTRASTAATRITGDITGSTWVFRTGATDQGIWCYDTARGTDSLWGFGLSGSSPSIWDKGAGAGSRIMYDAVSRGSAMYLLDRVPTHFIFRRQSGVWTFFQHGILAGKTVSGTPASAPTATGTEVLAIGQPSAVNHMGPWVVFDEALSDRTCLELYRMMGGRQ